MSEKSYHYIPVEGRDIKNGQYITSFGTNVIKSNMDYPTEDHPHTYNFNWKKGRVLPDFGMVFIMNGDGVFETREQSFSCSAGTLFVILPGQWHRYKPNKKTGWTEQWVCFNGSYFHSLQKMQLLPKTQTCYDLNDKTLKEFSHDFNIFIKYISKHPCNNLKNTGWLLILLQTLQDLSKSSNTYSVQPSLANTNKIDTRKIIQFIWDNSHQPINVSDVSHEFQTTTRTLERHFKQHHKRGVMQEIIYSRIYRAEKLLCETDDPIKTISYICGFTNVRNLIRAFKQVYNSTPRQYRILKKPLGEFK